MWEKYKYWTKLQLIIQLIYSQSVAVYTVYVVTEHEVIYVYGTIL